MIDGVTIRGNTFTGNNHLGMVVGERVRNVTISANRFDQNGRQGLHIVNADSIENVSVTANTFVQSVNNVCQIFCSWYQVAHVERGVASRGVTIRANRYEPAPPVVLGAGDPSPL